MLSPTESSSGVAGLFGQRFIAGVFDHGRVRRSEGDRPVLDRAARRRRRAEPVRLAEGPLRPVV